jgi:hypothetical protein
MYYIGLDVHKKTISYCVKDAAGRVYQEGKIGSTRNELDVWIRTLTRLRTIAMEAGKLSGEFCPGSRPMHAQPTVCYNRHPVLKIIRGTGDLPKIDSFHFGRSGLSANDFGA